MHGLVSKELIIQIFALSCIIACKVSFWWKWLHIKHFGGKLINCWFKGLGLGRDGGKGSEFNKFAEALLLEVFIRIFAQSCVIWDAVKEVSDLDC